MANGENEQVTGDVQRAGGEAELQQELRSDDEAAGETIHDQPYSEDREERRRGQFVDLHEDEDNDPQTSEATYGKDP